MQVLIIGGYGFFGSRLVRLLSDIPDLHIVIAGRNLQTATALCAQIPDTQKQDAQKQDAQKQDAYVRDTQMQETGAHCTPLRLDRTLPLSSQCATISPDIIVDASGPFQTYGTDDDPTGLSVARYALKIGAHYIDLADSADFVMAIKSLDAQAKACDVFMLTGLSTYPALTRAAVDALRGAGPSEVPMPVAHIESGIAPSAKLAMGRNVIAAITAYAGRPVMSFRQGRLTSIAGLTDIKPFIIRPPGRRPLRRRYFTNVDAPDGHVLPDYYPDLKNVWSGVGTAPVFLNIVLIMLARLAAKGLFPPLRFFKGLIQTVQKWARIGEHRGGMFVRISNQNESRSWHMIAEGDDGPFIPVIAASVIIRRAAQNAAKDEVIAAGARSGSDDLTLADFDRVFSQLAIHHGMRESVDPNAPVYRQHLGAAFDILPEAIQDLHNLRAGDGTHTERRFSGEAQISRGRGPIVWLLGALFRFPKASAHCPLTVTFTREAHKEIWRRQFGDHVMRSTQEVGRGTWAGYVIERFGPIALALSAVTTDSRLTLYSETWSCFGIPLPRALMPGPRRGRDDVYESVEGGVFHFTVDLRAPLLGRLVCYQGWLKPDDTAS